MSDILKSSLNRLQKNGYIMYDDNELLAVPIEYEIALDENGKTLFDKKTRLPIVLKKELPARIITQIEKEKIMELKFRVAESMGCKNETDARLKGLGSKFNNLLSKKLEEELGLSYYFKGISIVKCRDRIAKYVDENPVIKELNEILVKNHTKSFIEEYERHSYKYWEDDVRTHESFVDTQIELLDYTVNIQNGYILGNQVKKISNMIKNNKVIDFPKKKIHKEIDIIDDEMLNELFI